jgi:Fe-S-cluster containining protein
MSQEQPWYKDGLQFTCTQCGNCCTGRAGVVWVDDEEIEAIATRPARLCGSPAVPHKACRPPRLKPTEHANGDCTFDGQSRKCTIYGPPPPMPDLAILELESRDSGRLGRGTSGGVSRSR